MKKIRHFAEIRYHFIVITKTTVKEFCTLMLWPLGALSDYLIPTY